MPWITQLVDLALPRRCVGCTAAGGMGLCARCLPAGPLVQAEIDGLVTVAAARYEGAVRAALLHYKERGRRDLAGVLGAQLARAVGGLLAERGPPDGGPRGAVVLVPVPSSRRAAAARGGDHVLRLARRAGHRLALPVPTPLELTRSVRDSAGLGSAERARNLAASMAARAPTRAGAAILVDDIVTTGATLREARRALVAGGWPVLGAATVAATPRLRRGGGVVSGAGSGADPDPACPPIGAA